MLPGSPYLPNLQLLPYRIYKTFTTQVLLQHWLAIACTACCSSASTAVVRVVLQIVFTAAAAGAIGVQDC